MASPDGPDETVGAEDSRSAPLSATPIESPVYRPRRRTARYFWSAFVVAAIVVGSVVWFVLAVR